MYETIKQYVIRPFARALFGDYEAQESMLEVDSAYARRVRKYAAKADNTLDEICFHSLGKGAG